MKANRKKKHKGCACYGVNSIHPCFCSPTKQKAQVIEAGKISKKGMKIITKAA